TLPPLRSNAREAALPAHRVRPAGVAPSLHDALPICPSTQTIVEAVLQHARNNPDAGSVHDSDAGAGILIADVCTGSGCIAAALRSEEHTSELQSRENLVCRLLLEQRQDNPGEVDRPD